MTERCNSQSLPSLLSEYGWRYHSVGDNAWRSGWQGNERFFGLEINLDEYWLTFSVKPLVHTTLDWTNAPEAMRFLLDLNDRVQLVRIAIDENGTIVMRAQVLTDGFGSEQLHHVLGIVGYYADSLSREITLKLQAMGFAERDLPQHLA